MKSIIRLLAALALIAGFDAAAQDNAVPKEALQLIDSLHYQSGKINIDAAYVREHVSELAKKGDLSKFVL